jgi:putative spermidine/putrescine transport system permease protein
VSWLDAPASETQVTHRGRLWLYALAGIVMVFLVVPTVIVVPMSFSASQYLEFPPREWSLRWYANYFNSSSWMQATATSFKAALLTTLVATPLGTMAAYGLFNSRFRAMRVVAVVLITPIIVPVVLVAIAVFYVYARLGLVNSLTGIVLAHTMLAIPLVIMVVTSALKSYDMNQEMVARSLGASWIMALFVSGGANSTLTRNMFNALRDQIDPTIAAISTIMVLVTSILLALAQIFGQPRKP